MRADRLVSIVMLLQARGKMTASRLATELEVSRRTILRDIEALSFAGVPIYTEGGHGGGIALDEKYRTTLTGLTETEVHALFLAGNNELLREVGLGGAAARTERKLLAALPLEHQPAVDFIRQRIYIDPLWWWHDSQPMPFWSELQTALYQDRALAVVYEKHDGEIVERVLRPYGLVSKSTFWYLVAEYQGQLRTYRVARLRSANVLADHFDRDPAFDLIAYWKEHLDEFVSSFSVYECTLRIHPDRIGFARWLAPRRTRDLGVDADGWVRVCFRLESPELAKMLVFGLGAHCEVVEPQELHTTVLAACQTILSHRSNKQDDHEL
jgi:predicted DNA-binding transcriptional regulator YafY